MKPRAVGHFVIIKPAKGAEESAGGLLVARSEGERTEAVGIRGTVVSMGSLVNLYVNDKTLSEADNKIMATLKKVCQVGDEVFISKWDNHKISIQGVDYLVVKDEFIMVVIEKEESTK